MHGVHGAVWHGCEGANGLSSVKRAKGGRGWEKRGGGSVSFMYVLDSNILLASSV